MIAKFIYNKMVVWAVIIGCIAMLIFPLAAQSTSPCDFETNCNNNVNYVRYRSDYINNLHLLLSGNLLNQFNEIPLKATLFLLGSIVFYFLVYFVTKLKVYKKYCDKLFTRKVNVSIFSATALAAILPFSLFLGVFLTIGEAVFLYLRDKQNNWWHNILIAVGANISFLLVVATLIVMVTFN